MVKKKITFTKKISDNGLLKKEINAFNVCVVCGNCGKTDKLIAEILNPKEYGWIFMDKFNNEKIGKGGCWFCSIKCKNKQIKRWKKKR